MLNFFFKKLILLFSFLFVYNSSFSQELSETINPNNKKIEHVIKLQLKWKHQFQFAGYYAAKIKGFYADEGLDVTIIEGGRQSDPIENVLKGEVDFGISDVDLLYAKMQGKPVVVLAAIFQHSHHILLSKKSKGIRNPSDLIGKKVMISDYIGVAQLKSIFYKEGLSIKDIEIISDRWNFDALLKDSVDMITGYITDHPYRLQTLGFEPFVIHAEDYGIDFYGDMVFTSKQTADNKTELVKKFKLATIRGWEYAVTHPDEIIDYILKHTNAKERDLDYNRLKYESEAIKNIVLYGYVDIGHINPGRIETMAKTLQETGFFKGEYNLEDFVFDPEKKSQKLFQILIILFLITIIIFILAFITIRQLRRIIKNKTKDLEEEILQRKNIELILRENEIRYKLLFDYSPLCLIETDFSELLNYLFKIKSENQTDLKTLFQNNPDLLNKCLNIIKVIDINQATCKIFNINNKNDFIENHQSFYKIKSLDTAIEYLSSIASQTNFFSDEIQILLNNDTEKIFILQSSVVSGFESNFKKVLISLVDITERKKMEKDLQISEKKYRTLFLEFQSILDSVPDGIIVLEKNHSINWMNYYAKNVINYKVIKVNDKYCCKILFDQDLPCNVCLVDESARTKKPQQREFSINDGKIMEMRSIPILDDQNELISIIIMIRDITIKKHLEEEMFRKEKIESVGVLAGGIAHDFNNLLTAVLGNISLSIFMLNKGEKEKLEKYLISAEKAVKRAKDLTFQLLTFSKGGAPIKKVTTIKDIIIDSAKFVLRGSKNKLELNIQDDLFAVEADSGQISQVIQNLVLNADQAMAKPGTIAIKAENIIIDADNDFGMSKGKYIKVTVIDEGCGIPDEIKSKIFDPYFTTKPDGNGLGLATSYSIIKKHQGYITLESEIGKGSKFSFYLPAVGFYEYITAENTPTVISGNSKIMIIDDEEMIRNLLTDILENLGYQVYSFKERTSALEEYKKQKDISPFDLVITDLTIPGDMGGKEFINEILKIDKDAKVIVSSGYSNHPLMSNYKKYGFKAVITKPYVVEDLAKIVDSVIKS